MIAPACCSPIAGARSSDESPSLIFPNGFDPRGAIFNAHRTVEGDLFLVRDPLQALTAYENGIENVVAFLTENVTALQLEQLATLMDERKCETFGNVLSLRKQALLFASLPEQTSKHFWEIDEAQTRLCLQLLAHVRISIENIRREIDGAPLIPDSTSRRRFPSRRDLT